MSKKTEKGRLAVTSLDEIRAQAEPEVITIPGFRPGTTINVKVRPVDVTPYILGTETNPLLAAAMKAASEGKSREEIAREVEATASPRVFMASIFDDVAKAALVEPTYEEITAIAPLTFTQKQAIFDHAVGDLKSLAFFRGK